VSHQLTIAGNLSADPEMRYLPDGTPVTTFRMASNDFGNTVWFRVSVWRKQAEAVAEYLKKGRLAMVYGRMSPDRETGSPKIWTDSNGNPRASYEVTADRVVFLSGGGDRTEEDPAPVVSDDDIPF